MRRAVEAGTRRGPWRRAAALLVATAAVAAGLIPGPSGTPGLSTAAYAEEARLPGSLSTVEVSRRTVLLPVPDGVVPRRLVGKVRVDTTGPGAAAADVDGRLQVLVGDRVAETVRARPRLTLRTPVRRADVDGEGMLPVVLQWEGGCAPPGVVATMADLRLVHGGVEDAPRSERDFFGDAVTRVDVVVPRSAKDDVLQAALDSVAALARRYGEDVVVSMDTVDAVLPRVGAGQRVLRLEGGGTLSRGLEQRFGLWTLTLRGPGAELADVVRRAVGAPDATAGPAAVSAPDPSRTLAELGTTGATLGGWGTSSTGVALPQDLLGGPVDGLDVRLVGSHTALPPGTTARVDVRVDGALLESVDLSADDDSSLDLGVEVPGSRLRSGSALEVSLTTVADGGCEATTGTLPVALDLDGTRSTVTTDPGGPEAGFQRLPASLEGTLPVAVRTQGRARATTAADAGRLVAALQRVAGLPLSVELVDADELLADDRSGLLAGAKDADALAVQAPVRLQPGGEVAVLGPEEPFAALQAVRHRDRDLLLLGAWTPRGTSPAAIARALVEEVTEQGWSAWEGGALVKPREGVLRVLDPAPPSDPLEPAAEEGNDYAAYLVAAAAVLVLLLVLQTALVIRKDRRTRADAAGRAGPDAGT